MAGFAYDGTDADFVVLRYSADGALDKTFGVDGVARAAVSDGDDLAFALAVASDGTIVLVGTRTDQSGASFAAARFTEAGAPDETFGDGGVVEVPVAVTAQATGVVVQDDGKIVLGGSSDDGAGTRFAAVRLDADGTLDETFGAGGVLVADLSPRDDGAYAMTQQEDGALLLAGEGRRDSLDFALLRLLP